MKQEFFRILENIPIAKDIFKITLSGNTHAITKPGQFVNIKLDGHFLRRPISVCDFDQDTLTLIYKVVGAGTEQLSTLKADKTLDVLTGLGNGFDLSPSGQVPLLIGGGVGIPPLYKLCKELSQSGKSPSVVLGFNSHEDVFFEEEFKKIAKAVYVSTADGSYKEHGFVTDIVKNLDYTYFFTCGPEPMLRAVDHIAKTSGQFSFEARMACGFGACMGCSCKTKYQNKRICKDGPVLFREEIIW